MSDDRLALFALESGREYGQSVARALGVRLAAHEEREFEWGQHKARTLEAVRGRDVYVVQSLHGDPEHSVNDKLCRLLFFLASLKEAAADRVTAVVPYLCYSRKDRQTKDRDPVTTRYVAALFEAVGVDCLLTVEVHNVAAFQNAFRCRTEHLETHALFARHISARLGDRDLVVVSPDVGGVKRAARLREALERSLDRPLPEAFLDKRRSEGRVSGAGLVGDVRDRTVLLVDDMICGGTTIVRAAALCHEAGAREVFVAAAHGVFMPEASRALQEAPIERIAVLDHAPPFALDAGFVESRLDVVDGASWVAEAIRRLHTDGSLTELVADGPSPPSGGR